MTETNMTLHVVGMTCGACVTRVEKAVEALHGVDSAKASLKGGTLEVRFEPNLVSAAAIRSAVEGAGYAVARGRGNLLALGLGLFLVAGYLAADALGLFARLPSLDRNLGYGMLFVVGLLTSVHCVAMCGGLALSQGLGALGPEGQPVATSGSGGVAGPSSRLRPGLLYNLGRVLSYTAVGALVGGIGAAFSFSPVAKGLIAGFAGLVMLVLGLKMLGLVGGGRPSRHPVTAGLRRGLSGLARRTRAKGPLAMGLLNGLMPCGPLQTMQVYALGTGSLLSGAFSMFLFSLGTVPLMLFFGVAAAFLPRKVVPVMIKSSAVLVLFLGVLGLGRAGALAGLSLPDMPALLVPAPASAGPVLASRDAPALATPLPEAELPVVAVVSTVLESKVVDGVQTISMDFDPVGYMPFTVQAGLPLKWTIHVRRGQLNGCNNPLTVPAYGITKVLVEGDNVIEFTPKGPGTIVYTCWMGMIRNRITVAAPPVRK